jgi:hypothetical protein
MLTKNLPERGVEKMRRRMTPADGGAAWFVNDCRH